MERLVLSYDDLPSYVGVRLQIEKLGLDKKVAVFEGVIKGSSPISQIGAASLKADRRWTMVQDSGEEIHFVPEGDGWTARRI